MGFWRIWQMQHGWNRIFLLLPLFSFLISLNLNAQGNSENVRSLNGRVLQLHSDMRKADTPNMALLRGEAAPVLAQRATALAQLIRQDPAAALGMAFSKELRAELLSSFPGSAADLEEHGSWTGTSDHLIFDDPERQVRRYQVQLRNGSELIQVYSASGEPHCVSNEVLTAEGIRVGNVVAAGSTSVQSTGAVAAAGCVTTGDQKIAVLMVQFPGVLLPSNVTPAGVWDIFFGSSGRTVNNYWREASYGKASASGDVFGAYTLDRVYSCDEYSAMRTAAIAAADPQVNFLNYTRVFIVFPNPGDCSWAGLGTLGCNSISSADGVFTASTSWLLATYMGTSDNGVRLATHEGGHNLTLHHASSRDYGSEALGALSDPGVLSEYGDTHSTMGSWNFGHYGAPHKVRMGWLSAANVATTESNGSFTVLPFEAATGGVQALKIRRGTGNNAWLWLEYRQPIGDYDSTLNSQLFGGGLIHYEDSTTSSYTHLLDFSTATSSFADAALTGSWADAYSNLSLSVTSATAGGLGVNVFYGTVPCARAQPTVTLSPPNPSVYSGSNVSYTMSVLNNDSSSCAPVTLNLDSVLPDGWPTSFSAPSLTLNPGQSESVTMTKSVAAGLTPGTYAVSARVSDAEHAAVGNANCTVSDPPAAIFVAQFSVSPAVVSAKTTVTIQATITNSGSVPASGASVTFRITRPGGAVTSFAATTNLAGVASWSYRPTQKGTYSVTLTASSAGATVNGGPVSFTVR
jgi:M6 family metalloprotease-like protein